MSQEAKREARVERKTEETDIVLNLVVDGNGKSSVKTGVPFLDHMLTLFAKHGLFDLEVAATGDVAVDLHHTNEDVAICLGQAFKQALGDKVGMHRYGFFYVPMDDALVHVSLDISNRPYVVVVGLDYDDSQREDYYHSDMEHFFQSFAQQAGVNMHVDVIRGKDKHHIIEAAFKAVARAMDMATRIDERVSGVPSSKGVL